MVIFEIRTPEDLLKINDIIYDKSENFIFSIRNDIDLEGHLWTPIGLCKEKRLFLDQIDGNNHTIKNMQVLNSEFGGFVARNLGEIRNLFFDDTCTFYDFKSISQAIGTVCAINNGVVRNCKSAARIVGSDDLGGICGVSLCLPFDQSTIPAEINGCSFYGKIKGRNRIGGICGTSYSICSNVTNVGLINGVDTVGGIIGHSFTGRYSNMVNKGVVNGKTNVSQIFGVQNDEDNLPLV
jgi:hypothetical protein